MPSRRNKIIVAIASVALFVGGGAVAWNNGVRNRLFPKKFGVVEEGKLYRSGQIDRHLIEGVLRDHHIGLVIYMAPDELQKPDVAAEREAAERLGIRRINLPLDGKGRGDPMQYVRALEEIRDANAKGMPVLVHCAAGAQRTGGVTALYRLLVQHRPVEDAMAELKSYGHDPSANPELIPFLNQHMAEIAKGLADAHVIDAVPERLPKLE